MRRSRLERGTPRRCSFTWPERSSPDHAGAAGGRATRSGLAMRGAAGGRRQRTPKPSPAAGRSAIARNAARGRVSGAGAARRQREAVGDDSPADVLQERRQVRLLVRAEVDHEGVLPRVEREQVLLVHHDSDRVLPHLVVMELPVDPIVGQKDPPARRRFRACPQILFPVRSAPEGALDRPRELGLRLLGARRGCRSTSRGDRRHCMARPRGA